LRDRVIGFRAAADDPGGRIEAHGFGEHTLGVFQVRKIVEGGQAAVENPVDFVIKLLGGGGVLREQIPGPHQSVGGGFVSGEEQREGLVADLLVAHTGATVLVLSEKEHRKKVAFVLLTGAAFGDDAVDRFVEKSARFFKTADGGQRQLFDPFGKRHQHHVEQDHHLGEGVADLVGVGGDVGAEQRFRHHAEGEARHFTGHIELCAGRPLFAGLRGSFDHRRRIADEPVAMKGGLDQAALAAVKFTFAGK